MIYCTSLFVEILARKQAQGTYQDRLAAGLQRISGSDIENRWGARYKKSRENLIGRIVATGLTVDEQTVGNRSFLVVGVSQDDCEAVTADELIARWI